jgi:hypothetical protein
MMVRMGLKLRDWVVDEASHRIVSMKEVSVSPYHHEAQVHAAAADLPRKTRTTTDLPRKTRTTTRMTPTCYRDDLTWHMYLDSFSFLICMQAPFFVDGRTVHPPRRNVCLRFLFSLSCLFHITIKVYVNVYTTYLYTYIHWQV